MKARFCEYKQRWRCASSDAGAPIEVPCLQLYPWGNPGSLQCEAEWLGAIQVTFKMIVRAQMIEMAQEYKHNVQQGNDSMEHATKGVTQWNGTRLHEMGLSSLEGRPGSQTVH